MVQGTGFLTNKRTSINVSELTKEDLDTIKHPGQSYDGLIRELIRFWKQRKPKEVSQVTAGS